MRIGNLYGADATFLGVPAADPDVASEWSASGAAIIGAPSNAGQPKTHATYWVASHDEKEKMSAKAPRATHTTRVMSFAALGM